MLTVRGSSRSCVMGRKRLCFPTPSAPGLDHGTFHISLPWQKDFSYDLVQVCRCCRSNTKL